MTEIDLSRVSELMAQGKSDRYIADALQLPSRHHARRLMDKAKLEQARSEQRGDVITVDPEPETVEEFVTAIKQCLQKSVDGFVEAGRHLANAKLKHRGEFVQMVERDLGMSARMAQQLMAIAQDERFTNHGSHLPTTWRTLYELTRLDDEEFERGIESGAIHPGMEREDAIRLKNPATASPDGEARTHTMGSGPAAAAPPRPITNPAAIAPPPDGEGPHARLEGSERVAVPPLQGSGVRNQESESEVMHSEAGIGTPSEDHSRGMGSANQLPGSVTPPRPAVSEPGGAEESKASEISLGESKPAWNASRITPRDDPDFFPTGPWITRTLFERVLPQVGLFHSFDPLIQSVWEPACGEGHMAEVIREYVPSVHTSDIRDYGYGEIWDFLQTDTYYTDCGNVDWIITNPPYNGRALEFALRALDLAGEGVALFTSVQWIAEGVERYERLFRERPPTLIAFFVERAPVHQGKWEPDGGTKQAYCWIVWRKNHRPKAPFWIPPGCRESLTRPDDAERFTAHPVIRKDHTFSPSAHDSPREQPARSGEMPDIPAILDRRKEQTEQT